MPSKVTSPPPGPRVIACVNEKGGVGKTTSVVEVGAVLATTGKRVLLIDTDPQHSLREWVDQVGLEETPFDIASIEHPSELAAVQEVAADYDFVLIDTPGTRAVRDLVAQYIEISDFLIVVSEVDGMALRPADRYIDELVIPSGKPYAVLLTKWDARRPQKLTRAREFFESVNKPTFTSVIRSYSLFADAFEEGVYVTTSPRRTSGAHKAAGDYERAALELMSTIATL
ncbi:MAG: ParA family protein [Brevibacterium aurantiacum]